MPLLLLFFVLTIYMSFRKNETPIQLTDRQTDGELTKNFTFSNFFENRMLAGAHSL